MSNEKFLNTLEGIGNATLVVVGFVGIVMVLVF